MRRSFFVLVMLPERCPISKVNLPLLIQFGDIIEAGFPPLVLRWYIAANLKPHSFTLITPSVRGEYRSEPKIAFFVSVRIRARLIRQKRMVLRFLSAKRMADDVLGHFLRALYCLSCICWFGARFPTVSRLVILDTEKRVLQHL